MHSSTPTRVRPGLVIPGVDTKSTDNDMATAVTYLGLYTPPHSAHESPHESRRGSIQSSWPDTLYSARASGYASSYASTPVHRLPGSHDSLMHGLSETDLSNVSAACRHLDDQIADSDFHLHACHTPTVYGNPLYPNASQHIVTDTFNLNLHFSTGTPSTEAWTSSLQPTHMPPAQTTCLGSELFTMARGLVPDSAFLGQGFSHMESPLHGFDVNLDVTSDQSGCNHGISQAADFDSHQYPQIIVPSQVSPQDPYDHSQFDDCSSLDHSSSAISSSFGCSSATLDSFEDFDSPSPQETYSDRVLEHKKLMLGMLESSNSRRPRSATGNGDAATRKRRASKRVRGDRRPWHRHQTAGIEVQCQGKQFRIDKPIKYEAGDERKPHACTHLKDDGTLCKAKFERSEHLKRHKASHTPVRLYTCPAERCEAENKRFTRSDNACDHFRTHLRPHKKGKRNDHVEWQWLHHAIYETYEDKVLAKRVILNLTTWVNNHWEEISGDQRG